MNECTTEHSVPAGCNQESFRRPRGSRQQLEQRCQGQRLPDDDG